MEQIITPELFVKLGELLTSYLRIHLSVLIIIGGLLVLIDIYHRRYYDNKFIKDEFSKQADAVKDEQNSIENFFLRCAFYFSILVPLIAIVVDILYQNEIYKFTICLSYISLLTILYIKTRNLNKKLVVLSGSLQHMKTYRESIHGFEEEFENPFEYYNT